MYTTKYTTTSNCNSSLRGGVDINPYQVVTRSLTHADLLSEFDIRRGLVLALGSIQYTTLTVYSHVVLIINPRTLITHKAHFCGLDRTRWVYPFGTLYTDSFFSTSSGRSFMQLHFYQIPSLEKAKYKTYWNTTQQSIQNAGTLKYTHLSLRSSSSFLVANRSDRNNHVRL